MREKGAMNGSLKKADATGHLQKMWEPNHMAFSDTQYIDPPVYLENVQKFLGPHYFQTI